MKDLQFGCAAGFQSILSSIKHDKMRMPVHTQLGKTRQNGNMDVQNIRVFTLDPNFISRKPRFLPLKVAGLAWSAACKGQAELRFSSDIIST